MKEFLEERRFMMYFIPLLGELIIASGEEITEEIADKIENSPIEQVEIRSVLTCESKKVYAQNVMAETFLQVKWFR
jgi:hypothetical protein